MKRFPVNIFEAIRIVYRELGMLTQSARYDDMVKKMLIVMVRKKLEFQKKNLFPAFPENAIAIIANVLYNIYQFEYSKLFIVSNKNVTIGAGLVVRHIGEDMAEKVLEDDRDITRENMADKVLETYEEIYVGQQMAYKLLDGDD